MMKKIATLVGLSLCASSVMGQCAANWITTAAGITSTGDTGNSNAAVTADNTWATCATLTAGGDSCCIKTEVATFQTKADALVTALKTAVGTRDQEILDRRGDVLSVKGSLTSIQNSIASIEKQSGVSLGDSLTSFFSSYEDLMTDFAENFDTLKANFITYQKDRQTCFNKLVQAQVAIWCGACLDDPSTVGIDTTNSAITYGTTFSNAVAGACSAYLTDSIEQSSILSFSLIASSLNTLASALEKLANGDTTGATTELTEFLNDYTDVTAPTNVLKQAGGSIGTCTSTSCDWITTSLFDEGVLVNNLAVVGGTLSVRRLQGDLPAGRMLQFNNDPATEAAGITVDFPQNPGNVDNDQNDGLSAVRNGVVACGIAAFAALF